MCGIAGLVCNEKTCGEEYHIPLVREMCDLQQHRGPDDSGIVSLGKVCLGSVRLSIIDLTDAGHMPMPDATERRWISYNGEVYNFESLREQLQRSGHVFRSKTDTEVVLRAFEAWGEEALHRFVGMFAFAIYDRTTGTLKLVRDRFGIKPLYYMRLSGHILFASEMKALLRVNDRPKVNKQRLIEWSLYRNVDSFSSETLVEDICSVLPGHVVTVKAGEVSSRCYYSPPHVVDPLEYERFSHARPDAVVEEIEIALQRSVRDRLVSDVPLGTLCSGGIDSSLITALAARDSKEVTAFHVSVAGYPELDELPYAEQVARSLGARLIPYSFDRAAFCRELPRAIYLSDIPLTHPNSIAFFLISQIARANGVIVLLSGEGADELFGGYAWRYRRYRNLLRARRFLSLLPRKLRKGIELAGYACNGMPATGFLFDELLPHTVSFLDKYAREEWSRTNENAYRFVADPLDRAVLGAMSADLTDFLSPLLRRLDRMSMGASVECRVPFLDHSVVEKLVNLPLAYRVSRRSDKWVLKQIASRYLSQDIVNRKKIGFTLPLKDYVAPFASGEMFHDGFCENILGLNPTGIQRSVASWDKNIQGFFNLVSLEIWGRLFIFNEPLEQVTELVNRVQNHHREGRV